MTQLIIKKYDVGKSLTKAVKYPLFAIIVGAILKLLEITIAGFAIEFPEIAEMIAKTPGIAVGLGIIIFVYDWFKHKMGVKLP